MQNQLFMFATQLQLGISTYIGQAEKGLRTNQIIKMMFMSALYQCFLSLLVALFSNEGKSKLANTRPVLIICLLLH